MEAIKIYVGTYKKYNDGNLFGEWINLSDFTNYDELKEKLHDLHKDENDPEFMIQDFECCELIKSLDLIGESYISEEIYDIIDAIDNSSYDSEIILSYIECFGNDDSIYEIIEKVEETYSGEFDDDEEFVQELLESTGEVPSDLPCYVYIDWERAARDIMFDYSNSNNHYFRVL